MGRGRFDLCPFFLGLLRSIYPGYLRRVSNRASLVVFFSVDVTATIAHLVSVEVLWRTVPPVMRLVAMMGIFPVVAVIRVISIVDVAMEMLGAVKPWAGTNENPV